MRISACVITKNEEKNIARSIESYRKWVQEIIVVDTGSTDNTVSIVRSYGAKVYNFTWISDFSAAKNYALSKATGDWIIFLDADEYFSPANLRSIIETANKRHADIISCQLINIDEDNGDRIQDFNHQTRIFRNSKYLRYQNAIHEVIVKHNGKPVVAGVSPHDLTIYHTGYSSSKQLDKCRRNLKMLLIEAGTGKKGYDHYISECYLQLGDYEKVLEYALRHIDSKIVVPGCRVKPYILAIQAMELLEIDFQEIRKFTQNTIDIFPNHPDPIYHLALNSFNMKKFDEAYRLFERTLELYRSYKDEEAMKIPAALYQIYCLMGVICELRNEYKVTLEWFVSSLHERCQQEKALLGLLNLVRNQPSADIVLLLKAIYKIDDASDLEFLINALRTAKMGSILLYFLNLYANLEPKQQKLDVLEVNSVLVLLFNKEYQKAADIFINSYERNPNELTGIYTVISVLLSDNPSLAFRAKNQIAGSFSKVIDAYYTPDCNVHFSEEELGLYLNILEHMLNTVSDEQLKSFLTIKKFFSEKVSLVVGDKLLQNQHYTQAIESYNEYLNKIEGERTKHLTNRLATIYKKIGYCYYRIRQYSLAVKNLSIALREGYRENDIIQYLNWIKEQCNDNRIINTINMIFSDEQLIKLGVANVNTKIQRQVEIRQLIERYLNESNLDEALTLINEYEILVREDAELYSMKAIVAIMQGRLKQAEEYLKLGLVAYPESFDILYNTAYLMEIQNEHSTALTYYKKSLKFTLDEGTKKIINDKIKIFEE